MGRKMSKFTIFAVRMKNTRFKVMELYGLGSRQLSYGFWASVLKNDTCTYATYIPDISCDRGFVDELARRCNEGQLSPMHLLDAVLDALS
jgi:hypothetical protein